MRTWDNFINETGRLCRKCLTWKPFHDFHKHKQCLGGYNTVCKECRKPISKHNYAKTTKEGRLLSSAKYRADIKNRVFTLKEEDIKIPEYCPVFGRVFEHKGDYSPSIDRIDSSKGYTKDNVKIISKRANMLKNNATIDEIRAILVYLEGCEV